MTKAEKLSHYGVIIIALTAVVVSVWQGRISQRQLEIGIEHNKLTVKPYLEFTKEIDGLEKTMEVDLSNQGYGPAIIKRFELTYDGQKFNAWNPVFSAAGMDDQIRQLYNYGQGSVVAPGASRTILRLTTENTRKGISLKIVYESIYQQLDSANIDF